MSITNIAGYRFFTLHEPQSYRDSVRRLCKDRQLKGTVLLSPEGINVALAGPRVAIDAVISDLNALMGIEISFKFSLSEEVPFKRMLVKVKPRLLPVLDQSFDEVLSKRTQLPSKTLHQWFKDKKNFVLLDTRNDYEYDLGTFVGAHRCDMSTFRKFQESIAGKVEEWKNKTIVTFCTGGIRCEKAVPVMINRLGFENVLQLEGGILQYFEDVGDEFWRGDCFVFDQRVALAPDLSPRPRPFCDICGKPQHDDGSCYCPAAKVAKSPTANAEATGAL